MSFIVESNKCTDVYSHISAVTENGVTFIPAGTVLEKGVHIGHIRKEVETNSQFFDNLTEADMIGVADHVEHGQYTDPRIGGRISTIYKHITRDIYFCDGVTYVQEANFPQVDGELGLSFYGNVVRIPSDENPLVYIRKCIEKDLEMKSLTGTDITH